MAYIISTGCSGYWGTEYYIMYRGRIVGTALSLETAKKKRDSFNNELGKS